MKYSLLLLIAVFSNLQLRGQTQEHIKWVSLSQEYVPMTIHFYDDTEVSGEGLVRYNADELYFKTKEQNTNETLSLYEIKKLVVHSRNNTISFIFVQPRDHRRPLLLQQLRSGKLNVYLRGIGDEPSQMIKVPKSSTYYYVEKPSNEKGNPVLPYLEISRNFRKRAAAYFEDCPALVEKILQKEFKRSEVLEIADFYNSECQ